MAFFLIGRGPEDDLRVLSESFFESRQEAMAELSRLSADPEFAQWDTDVFVLDLEQGVPVLLVRPQSTELPMTAEEVTPAVEVEAAVESGGVGTSEASQAVEPAEPIDLPEFAAVGEAPLEASDAAAEEAEPEPSALPEDEAEQGDLRDALLRTTEHMSAEGIVPPASAGLSAVDEVVDAEAETPSEAPEVEAEGALEAGTQSETEAAAEPDADNAWPWAATPPAPEAETDVVSPDIATVYEALEAEASADLATEAVTGGAEGAEAAEPQVAEDDSDFILDLDAIQPVALDENPAQAEGTEATPVAEETPEPVAAEAPSEDSYSSTLTDYTCEDCVYVETCPNRDQRAPKDCGSFQWK
jgi:hypothetical protein